MLTRNSCSFASRWLVWVLVRGSKEVHSLRLGSAIDEAVKACVLAVGDTHSCSDTDLADQRHILVFVGKKSTLSIGYTLETIY